MGRSKKNSLNSVLGLIFIAPVLALFGLCSGAKPLPKAVPVKATSSSAITAPVGNNTNYAIPARNANEIAAEKSTIAAQGSEPHVKQIPSERTKDVWVPGYTRKNGTHVNGYWRRSGR